MVMVDGGSMGRRVLSILLVKEGEKESEKGKERTG